MEHVRPPASLQTTHDDLLSLRNKVVGHKDATPAAGHSETPNVVMVVRDATGFELRTISIAEMSLEKQRQVKDLCTHFIAHCEKKLKPLMEKIAAEVLTKPVGSYQLIVSEPPSDWLTVPTRF